MNIVYLVKYGEIFTKGDNRYIFLNALVNNIKEKIRHLGNYEVYKSDGRIIVIPDDSSYDLKLLDELTKVFGVTGVSRAIRFSDKDLDNIKDMAKSYIEENIKGMKTFKVESKRSDKSYPYKSPEICSILGEHILNNFKDLKVDVNRPDFTLMVEVRDYVYIYAGTTKGAGGMPVGTNGKSLLLLSGGIDSPVAGWMIAKRGVMIEAVYFHSPPYTSDLAKEKVITLASRMARYIPGLKLHIVNFTEVQLYIREKCDIEKLTIIMRIYMMKIAEKISKDIDAKALVTGESIGQVASQTLHSLDVTGSSVDMEVFRPLIGFDKEEIVTLAKKIDTYDTSILPHEDCCTLFVARHPETKPKRGAIASSMRNLTDIESLVEKAIETKEILEF